jgi:hypothetical protein
MGDSGMDSEEWNRASAEGRTGPIVGGVDLLSKLGERRQLLVLGGGRLACESGFRVTLQSREGNEEVRGGGEVVVSLKLVFHWDWSGSWDTLGVSR